MIQRPARLFVLLPVLLVGLAVWLAQPAAAYADTYTVTTTGDDGPGSLRQAIRDANAHANAATRDTIAFAIPPAQCVTLGVFCTITPASALPPITDPVDLDAWTQGGGGYQGRPLVELNGERIRQTEGIAAGLTITGGNSHVRGLAINRVVGSGIALVGGSGTSIESNFIGTDLSGLTAQGNLLAGISISGSTFNAIGGKGTLTGNLISGNGQGIVLEAGSDHASITSNIIGANRLITGPLSNTQWGIFINGSSFATIAPHQAMLSRRSSQTLLRTMALAGSAFSQEPGATSCSTRSFRTVASASILGRLGSSRTTRTMLMMAPTDCRTIRSWAPHVHRS